MVLPEPINLPSLRHLPFFWVLNSGDRVGKRYTLINSFSETMWKRGGVPQRKWKNETAKLIGQTKTTITVTTVHCSYQPCLHIIPCQLHIPQIMPPYFPWPVIFAFFLAGHTLCIPLSLGCSWRPTFRVMSLPEQLSKLMTEFYKSYTFHSSQNSKFEKETQP